MEIQTRENTPVSAMQAPPTETVEPAFTPDELHSRLVKLEGDADVGADAAREIVEIVDDRVVSVRGLRLALSDFKTFIFNIQRLRQGEPLTAVDIKAAGFRGARTTFTNSVRELHQALNGLSDEPIIEKRGKTVHTTYTLLPDVKVVDRREGLTDAQKRERFLRDHIEFDEDKAIVHDDGVIAFLGPTARREVTQLMMEKFAALASADTNLLHMIDQTVSLKSRTLRSPIMPLKTKTSATVEDERPLLARKEAALRVFVRRCNDEYTPAEQLCIVDGIRATFDLFRINADLPLRTASRFYNNVHLPYQDLYQECALELFEGILEQSYDSTGTKFFRYIVSKRMKDRVLKRVRLQHSAVSYPEAEFFRLIAFVKEFEGQYGETPSRQAIAAETDMEPEEVEALLRLRSSVPLDDLLTYYLQKKKVPAVISRDFVDDELDRLDRADALDALFGGDALTDNEKIMLSMWYGVFHPALQGAEFQLRGEVKFVYPYTEADLLAAVRGKLFINFVHEVLKISETGGKRIHNRALQVGRKILTDHPGLTDYKSRVEQEEEYFEERRRQLIALALKLSPDKPLGIKEIRSFHKQGKFVSDDEVRELFHLLSNFQRLCGFSPNQRRPSHEMTRKR